MDGVCGDTLIKTTGIGVDCKVDIISKTTKYLVQILAERIDREHLFKIRVRYVQLQHDDATTGTFCYLQRTDRPYRIHC